MTELRYCKIRIPICLAVSSDLPYCLQDLSGETLLKKGPPPDPLTKTSNIILPLRSFFERACEFSHFSFLSRLLLRGKIKLKVFGKGFGEEPFFRKVFPNKSCRRYGKLLLTARHNRIWVLQQGLPEFSRGVLCLFLHHFFLVVLHILICTGKDICQCLVCRRVEVCRSAG